MFIVGISYGADVTLDWNAAEGAKGYKIYKSLNYGITWAEPIDVGLTTEFTYKDVEEVGLVLFRVSAYNAATDPFFKIVPGQISKLVQRLILFLHIGSLSILLVIHLLRIVLSQASD